MKKAAENPVFSLSVCLLLKGEHHFPITFVFLWSFFSSVGAAFCLSSGTYDDRWESRKLSSALHTNRPNMRVLVVMILTFEALLSVYTKLRNFFFLLSKISKVNNSKCTISNLQKLWNVRRFDLIQSLRNRNAKCDHGFCKYRHM